MKLIDRLDKSRAVMLSTGESYDDAMSGGTDLERLSSLHTEAWDEHSCELIDAYPKLRRALLMTWLYCKAQHKDTVALAALRETLEALEEE